MVISELTPLSVLVSPSAVSSMRGRGCGAELEVLVPLGSEIVKLCLSLMLRLCASRIGTSVPKCST